MEAAKGDPLRAQEIEDSVSGNWFHRLIAWRTNEGIVQDREQKELDKARRESKAKRRR